MRYRSILLALLSGVLLVLVFPKFNCSVLAWVALVPLLLALEGKGPRESFGLGLLTGFVGFFGVLYWIAIFTLPGLVLLALYLALYIGLFCVLLNFIGRRFSGSRIMIICVPSLWISLEYIRSFMFSGFPWAVLGYSQYLNIPLIQIASFSGVYGISFLIVLVNATIAYSIIEARSKRQEARRTILPVCIIALLLIGCFVYGWMIIQASGIRHPASSLKVAIVQGNIDLDEKWDPVSEGMILDTYSRLSREAAREGPALIVWPETTIPSCLKCDRANLVKVLELASSTKSYLIVGSLDRAYLGSFYNSAFLISPEGLIGQQYNKIHLVPFGEIVPLKDQLPFLARFVESRGGGGFAPGNTLTIFDMGANRFGTLICFETIFGNLVRKFVLEGAQFMVNITNDAWYGRSAASYQHFTFSVLRAVENRVPIVRAASTGVSAFIDRYGRIRKSEDIFIRSILVDDINLHKSQTFYTKFGDIFSYLCLMLSGIMMGLTLFNP